MTSSANYDTLPHRISTCALYHYRNVLPNSMGGKPQMEREWTVYSAIVACRGRGDAAWGQSDMINNNAFDQWVVSCATGSKCTSLNSAVSSFPLSGNPGNEDRKDAEVDPRDWEIIKSYRGMILKDSHAETLARRGFVAVLWKEIQAELEKNVRMKENVDAQSRSVLERESPSNNLLEVVPTKSKIGLIQFCLKREITLHLYISDSPCGDATIYDIKKLRSGELYQNPSNSAGRHDFSCNPLEFDTEVNFTGAKIILTGQTDGPLPINDPNISALPPVSICVNSNGSEQHKGEGQSAGSTVILGREDVQQLGALRLKSSRSNIPSHLRSTSMSCSDKIVRWGILGMQGTLLSAFIPSPICLSSVCVSRDPRSLDTGAHGGQLAALERALKARVHHALISLRQKNIAISGSAPLVAVVDAQFESSKSASEYHHVMEERNEREKNLLSPAITHYRLEQAKKRVKTDESITRLMPSNKTDTQEGVSNCLAELMPRKKIKKKSACGISINWHQDHTNDNIATRVVNCEFTIGSTGLKRGKKPKIPIDVIRSTSRLSRFSFIQDLIKCVKLSNQIIGNSYKGSSDTFLTKEILAESTSYKQCKQSIANTGIAIVTDSILTTGWVRGRIDDDFVIFKLFN